ncbi:MAG: fibronectin type III domain-containing protein [Rhodocyclaceae bacterium]|nr:fibronectin type III domain-containing protein [Rhodocyclaceae bacterium]
MTLCRISISNLPAGFALASAVMLALSGCAQITPDRRNQDEAMEQLSGVDKHSSFPAMRRDTFEQVNLVELLDPDYAKGLCVKHDDKGNCTGVEWGKEYDQAFARFRTSKASEDAKKLHRDSVQDRILGVSTSRCNVFKTYLRRQQVSTNFWLGSATTAAGVLGAVLPGVTASRNLAGAAGLFSGVQAEYNASYFSNLAAQVIIQGIELRQSQLLQEIVAKRQKFNVSQYTMEAAVKDAVYFDGTCSAVTGLMEAGDSIKEITTPGFGHAVAMLTAVKAAAEIAQAPNLKELQDTGRLATLLKQATPAATPLVVSSVKDAIAPDVNMSQSLYSAKLAIQMSAAELISKLEMFEGKKNTPAQTAVVAAKNEFSSGVSGCSDNAMAVVREMAAIQERLINATSESDRITLSGNYKVQSGLGSMIVMEVDKIRSQFVAASNELQGQIESKKFSADAAGNEVSKFFKDVKASVPAVCAVALSVKMPLTGSVLPVTGVPQPQNVRGHSHSGVITVSFSLPKMPVGTAYQAIAMNRTTGKTEQLKSDVLGKVLNNSIEIKNCTDGDVYDLSVSVSLGLNTSEGRSVSPVKCSKALPPPTKPGVPTNVSATSVGGAINVKFSAAKDGGSPITGYTALAANADPAKKNEKSLAAKVDGTKTEVAIPGCLVDNNYLVTVFATNKIKDGSPNKAPVKVMCKK